MRGENFDTDTDACINRIFFQRWKSRWCFIKVSLHAHGQSPTAKSIWMCCIWFTWSKKFSQEFQSRGILQLKTYISLNITYCTSFTHLQYNIQLNLRPVSGNVHLYLYTNGHVLIPRYYAGLYGSYFKKFEIEEDTSYFMKYYIRKNKVEKISREGEMCTGNL